MCLAQEEKRRDLTTLLLYYAHLRMVASIVKQIADALPIRFIPMTDRSLWLYIDYHIKNKYPVSIMSSNFKFLQGAIILAKKISTRHVIFEHQEHRQWKTTPLTPRGHYQRLGQPIVVLLSKYLLMACCGIWKIMNICAPGIIFLHSQGDLKNIPRASPNDTPLLYYQLSHWKTAH